MIGGNTRVNLDVPPFFLYSGFNVTPVGLNVVGLSRAGFSKEDISELKKVYRLLYRSGLKTEDALERISFERASKTRSKHARGRASEVGSELWPTWPGSCDGDLRFHLCASNRSSWRANVSARSCWPAYLAAAVPILSSQPSG